MNKVESIVVKMNNLVSDNYDDIDFEELDLTVRDLKSECADAVNQFFEVLCDFEFVESVKRTNAENACAMLHEVLDVAVEENDIYIDDTRLIELWSRSPKAKDAIEHVLHDVTGMGLWEMYQDVRHKFDSHVDMHRPFNRIRSDDVELGELSVG